MANPIVKIKRTDTVGKVPTVSDLAPGQLGYNIADRKIYARHDDPLGGVVQIAASPNHSHAIGDVANAVGSVTTGIPNSTQITNMIQITSAGYSALGAGVSPNTLYIIVG